MDLGLAGKVIIVTGATANIGRAIALPEEVSAAALFLASDRASFITGQVLRVDGGTFL